MIRIGRSLLAAALSFGVASMMAGSAWAANSASAGVLNIERPTLTAAGFDWRINGDRKSVV